MIHRHLLFILVLLLVGMQSTLLSASQFTSPAVIYESSSDTDQFSEDLPVVDSLPSGYAFSLALLEQEKPTLNEELWNGVGSLQKPGPIRAPPLSFSK